MDVRMFDSLESTNKYCELLDLSEVEEFTVICAREQTAGIGQRGNCWHSAAGMNLTFSLVLKPVFLAFERQYELTKAVSLGIADALKELLPNDAVVRIKWPNDIYIGKRKVCGVLISNRVAGQRLSASVVGIGLNVNETDFPEWVPNPVSLRQAVRKALPLDRVLGMVVDGIALRYRQLAEEAVSDRSRLDGDYQSRLLNLGVEMPYLYRNTAIRATIHGVNRFGHLELVTHEGESIVCQLKELVFQGLTD